MLIPYSFHFIKKSVKITYPHKAKKVFILALNYANKFIWNRLDIKRESEDINGMLIFFAQNVKIYI